MIALHPPASALGRLLRCLLGIAAAGSGSAAPPVALLERYCIECHDGTVQKGGLNLEALLGESISAHPAEWGNGGNGVGKRGQAT